jgi:hypothetical protein
MITSFIEIEKHLQNARFELASGKQAATLMALLKALESLSLEVRNHVQGRSNGVPNAPITQTDPKPSMPTEETSSFEAVRNVPAVLISERLSIP